MDSYKLILEYWGDDNGARNFADEIGESQQEDVEVLKREGASWVPMPQLSYSWGDKNE